MKRIAAIVLATAGLAACQTGPLGPPPPPGAYAPPTSPEAFRVSDFAWSTVPGSSRIDGVLAYRGDGGRYTCHDAILVPETPWTRARMRLLYYSTTSAALPAADVRRRTPTEHEAEYRQYARQAMCGPHNRFSFVGLPDGAWYVITAAAPVSGGPTIAIMRRVETDGDTTRVALR